MNQTILVTGAAGFIGMHLSAALLRAGWTVMGIDEINDYYDPKLKLDRIELLMSLSKNFTFQKMDIADAPSVAKFFEDNEFKQVIHLAAQAGVRYSLKNPHAYQRSNLAGMVSILEGCRAKSIEHLIYASSSSVYGANTKIPFHESDPVEMPISLYAATKRSNELMAYTYSHLFGLPATGLRFFTVYGPWGRPDMAYWSFTKAILEGVPIQIYGDGLLSRDFTYIDDIVSAILKLIGKPPTEEVRHRILNVGNSHPETVNKLIEALEQRIGKKAIRELRPKPPGDVQSTFSDSSALEKITGFRPVTPLDEGLGKFVDWYRAHYQQ